MKVLLVKLWAEGINEPWATFPMNVEGRLSYNFYAVPDDIKLSHMTIEPDDPTSKVEMTHYGAKYTP